MDYRDYSKGLHSDYYRDQFPHSLLSTRAIKLHERRTKVPSLETCLASVKSPGNHAFSL